jgi:antitoxin (DNA-binding transcriptional repressor) of toxin-antitoxin stability system
MLTVTIHDAKTQLYKLVDQAAKAEAFIIAKAGRPMVKVFPLRGEQLGTTYRLGFMQGEISLLDWACVKSSSASSSERSVWGNVFLPWFASCNGSRQF